MSGLYSQGPVHGERDTTMRDLVAVVFKRKWLILLFFAVACVLVGVKTVSTPETWSADATLMLQRQGRASALETAARALPWVEVIESEVEIAKSVPVLQIARTNLREPSDAFPEGVDLSVGQISSMVSTGMVGESNVIYVTSTTDEGKLAIRLANEVARAYVQYHVDAFALPDASSVVKAQADSALTLLEQLQAERETVLSAAGFTNLTEEEENLQSLRLAIRNELSSAQLKVAKLQVEVASIPDESQTERLDVAFPSPLGFAQGAGVHAAQSAYRKQYTTLEQLRSKYTDSHPKVMEARSELKRLHENLVEAIRELSALKREELKVAEAEADDLRRQQLDVEGRLAQMPGFITELRLLDTKIASLEKQYASLNEKYVDTHVRQVSYTDYGVKLLSPAISAYRNAKGDLVRLALVPLLSLLAGIGLAFYLENLDHSMKTREDVEQHLEIPVLASFPDVDSEDSQLEPTTRRTPFWKGRRGG